MPDHIPEEREITARLIDLFEQVIKRRENGGRDSPHMGILCTRECKTILVALQRSSCLETLKSSDADHIPDATKMVADSTDVRRASSHARYGRGRAAAREAAYERLASLADRLEAVEKDEVLKCAIDAITKEYPSPQAAERVVLNALLSIVPTLKSNNV